MRKLDGKGIEGGIMKKNIEYYMNLNYPVEHRKDPTGDILFGFLIFLAVCHKVRP